MEQKIEEWNQKREQLKRLEKECDKYRNAINFGIIRRFPESTINFFNYF